MIEIKKKTVSAGFVAAEKQYPCALRRSFGGASFCARFSGRFHFRWCDAR